MPATDPPDPQVAADAEAPAQVLITAAEAYPQLERLFLQARAEILGAFRVFDPETRLRSAAARACGDTWFDLVAATLRRGVRITLILSDFDPVHATDLHRTARRSLHRLRRAGLVSGAPGRLTVRAACHPAQTGAPLRLALARFERGYLNGAIGGLDAMTAAERRRWLRRTPGIAALLQRGQDGALHPRTGRLPPMRPVTHHQKMAVFDRQYLYLGGLDLDERRYDDPGHRRAGEDTWHDVQLCLRGPVAGAAADHLQAFLAECAGTQPPQPRPGLLRTLSVARAPSAPRLGPRPAVTEIRDFLLDRIARAERLIYVETQYLRDPAIATALARRGADVPGLSLVAVLPAAPDDVIFDGNAGMDARFGEYLQARAVAGISAAMGPRAVFVAPAQPKPTGQTGDKNGHAGAPLVYVHAKVCVFDDRTALVGSANLNGRSLMWDTETAVILARPDSVRDLRHRLMRHWLGDAADPAHLDPDTAARAWAATAAANADRPPEARTGFVLPFPLARARRFGRWLPRWLHPIV